MTSRKGHSFATRQLGTVLANPAGKPAVRQRLSPMASHLSLSPMSRWLGVGFVVREGQAYGGDGSGEERGDA